MFLRSEEPVFNRKLPNGDLQNFEISNFVNSRGFRMFVGMVVMMVAVSVGCAHFDVSFYLVDSFTGSSHRSGDSVCKVSLGNGYSGQISF